MQRYELIRIRETYLNKEFFQFLSVPLHRKKKYRL